MMEPFEKIDIQELPLSVPMIRRKVEDFLGSNGLRLGEVDLYLAVLSDDGAILAGGGLQRDILKCLAVSAEARSQGLSVPLLSRLISVASERGCTNLKVFTKPENRALFESLGFKLLAEAPKAILLENGRGLADYCAYLRAHPASGVIVMNANPFTLGHRYLVEQSVLALGPSTSSGTEPVSAGEPVEPPKLTIIPVKEDASRFPYRERIAMLRAGCDGLADVVEGSDYQISAATFPTYFLKDLSDAAETQMRLDIDLFGRHIAPALGAAVRFVGSEPVDPLTARYNALMKELLPKYGVDVVEIPRLTLAGASTSSASRNDGPVGEPVESPVLRQAQGPVTATEVRALVDEGRFKEASALTPVSTWPYLLAELAERALRRELDTPMKPGLVGPDSKGAHKDMDYDVMRKGIAAIRPFFPRMAMAETPEELRQLGIDAETAMLAATGGVNTHRGAIFALGLALNATGRLSVRRMESTDNEQVTQRCLGEMSQSISCKSLNDSELHSTAQSHGVEAVKKYGVKGARELASEGYKALFEDWLPFYRRLQLSPSVVPPGSDVGSWTRGHGREIGALIRIMSTLDDTCIIHRVGYERAQEVKKEAKALLAAITKNKLSSMCDRYAAEGISPGGAADMLALTIFMDSILN